MNIKLGKTAQNLRKSLGFNQRQAAVALGVSVVHLCNVENDKSHPSPALLARYRELWGYDLYVLAWCMSGDVERLPPAVRAAAGDLSRAWKKQLSGLEKQRKKDDSPCSTSGR